MFGPLTFAEFSVTMFLSKTMSCHRRFAMLQTYRSEVSVASYFPSSAGDKKKPTTSQE